MRTLWKIVVASGLALSGCGDGTPSIGAATTASGQRAVVAAALPDCEPGMRATGHITVEDKGNNVVVVRSNGDALCEGTVDAVLASGVLGDLTIESAMAPCDSDPMPATNRYPGNSDPMPADTSFQDDGTSGTSSKNRRK